jgi:hypothetical protein
MGIVHEFKTLLRTAERHLPAPFVSEFARAALLLLLLLLPLLLPAAAGEDLAVINGVCHTANSIFKRYRNQFSSDKLVAELAASQVGRQELLGGHGAHARGWPDASRVCAL